jgi:hypothetical protein
MLVSLHSLHHGQSIQADSSPRRSSGVTIVGFVDLYCIGGQPLGLASASLGQGQHNLSTKSFPKQAYRILKGSSSDLGLL